MNIQISRSVQKFRSVYITGCREQNHAAHAQSTVANPFSQDARLPQIFWIKNFSLAWLN